MFRSEPRSCSLGNSAVATNGFAAAPLDRNFTSGEVAIGATVTPRLGGGVLVSRTASRALIYKFTEYDRILRPF